MAITVSRCPNSERGIRSLPLRSTVAVVALLLPLSGSAADWRLTPTLKAGELYTDNVRLAPAGSEQSDFISELSPGLNLSASGQRLKLNASYAFQYLHYAHGSKGDTGFNKLDASANLGLIKDLLAIDGTAMVSQQSISALGPQANDNYSVTDNRTTVKSFSLSPYLHHEFRDIATSELRFTHNDIKTGTANLSSGQADDWHLSVNSVRSTKPFGWGVDYRTQRNSLANAAPVNSSTSSVNLRYLLTPHFALTGTGGYDRYDYIAAAGAPNPQGRFYTGGISWRPTERTSLSASVGDRFYGKTYSLDSSIRSRASVWRLSYDEEVTTVLSHFTLDLTDSTSALLNQLFRSSIPDDAARQQAVDRFMQVNNLPSTLTQSINYLTNEIFLQKALRASVALNGARNTMVLTAFDILRQPQSAQNVASAFSGTEPPTSGNIRQAGLSGLWSWRVTTLTQATFGADWFRSTADSNDVEDRRKILRAGLTCQLEPKLEGTIELRHTGQTSNVSGNSYTENAVNAFVSMRF